EVLTNARSAIPSQRPTHSNSTRPLRHFYWHPFPPLSSYFSARSPHQSFKNLSTALLPIPHFANSTPSNTSDSQESSLIKNSTPDECYVRRAEQYPVRWIADRHSATHRGFWAPSFSYDRTRGISK